MKHSPRSGTPHGDARASGAAPPKPRARGRRIAIVVYYGLAGAICTTATVQVTRQVFARGPASPYASCHDGLQALAAAVDRARRAAAEGEDPPPIPIDEEDAALERFRSALQPEWRYRDGVASSCKGSEKDERSLDEIERLRYAEEHAVRREAGDLAPLRRRVRAIVPPDPTSRPAPPAERDAPEPPGEAQ